MEGREWRCPNGCPTKGEVESHKKAVVHFEAECARLRADATELAELNRGAQVYLMDGTATVGTHVKMLIEYGEAARNENAALRASSVTLQAALDEALGEVGRLKADLAAFKNPGDHFAWQEARARLLSDCDSLRASLESADKMLEEVAGAGKVDVPAVDWIDYQIDRDLAARIDAYLAGRKS